MSRSHVKCKGRYDGCLGTAHRGAVLDLCTNCRAARQAEMEANGLDFHGRHKLPARKLDAVLDEISPRPPSLQKELHAAKVGIRVENVLADAETAGHGVMSPTDRFNYALATSALTSPRNAMAYLEMYRGAAPGTVLVDDPEWVPYDTRVEIRGLERTGAASHEELAETYAVSAECLEKILAEPDPEPEKEKELEEPTQEQRNRTAAHMQKMREARAKKKTELEAEVERLKAQLETNGHTAEPVASAGPTWKVMILRPVEVLVEAPTAPAAMALAQQHYELEPEQVVGIVKA